MMMCCHTIITLCADNNHSVMIDVNPLTRVERYWYSILGTVLLLH